VRRQTAKSGINPAGSSRALRLDPLSLPVSFSAHDIRADGGTRQVELHRERVVLRRAVRGMRMAVNVRVSDFLGVALRGIDDAEMLVLVRFHRWDDVLNLPGFDESAPSARALWHFGRGMAYAAMRKFTEAEHERQALFDAAAAVPADAKLGFNNSKELLSLAGHLLDESTEHVRTNVTVDHSNPGQGVERSAEQQLGNAVRAVGHPVVRLVSRQTRGVRDEMPYRHELFVRSLPLRNVALQRCVELDSSLLIQLHDRRGHPDHLRERRQVPQGMLVRYRAVRPVEMTDAVFRERSGMRSHHRVRSRERAIGLCTPQD